MKKLIYLITFLISISIVLAASTVDRSVPSTAYTGQTITITYTSTIGEKQGSLVITDGIPAGWTIVSSGDFGLSDDGKYMSLVEITASSNGLSSNTYSYTIRAGSTGTFKGYYKFQNGVKTDITPDDTVTVSGTCQPAWTCGSWGTCVNSIQTRSCNDGCGATNSETQPCGTTCTESWTCASWSTCSNGQQTRTCTDANTCGTTTSKPATSQSCGDVCTESWTCASWSTCSNGQQTRTCTDANTCGTTTSKPATSQSCGDVCTESWTCASWSTCSNGQQTRTCTDANTCGTTTSKPSTSQSCETRTCSTNKECEFYEKCKENACEIDFTKIILIVVGIMVFFKIIDGMK